MSYDVEIWHDTTMWNEGFEKAREPYVIVRVHTEQDADLVEQWVAFWNKSVEKLGSEGWGRLFTAQRHLVDPNHPGSRTPMPVQQAVGFAQGAISKWEGI